MLHVVLHFLLPFAIARIFFSQYWQKALIVFSLTMLVDLDHLLAFPIYVADRCSINFHPLHTGWAIGIYIGLLLPVKTRLIAIGLLLHMLLDWQQCWFPLRFWFE